MLDVFFRRQAEEDLLAIQAWYQKVAPDSMDRILADIYRSIEWVRENPLAVAKVPGHSYRRIVSRRYRFKVAYMIRGSQIDILGIYRYQKREK